MKVLADLCIVPMGVERTFFSMRFSTRRDKDQSMADKMKAIAGE